MIAIIDYGIGNLSSVKNALNYLGVDSKITCNPQEIVNADRIIFPGVGAFGFMMENLREKGLEDPIKKSMIEGKPFLGICLGLQALFEESEENPGIKGLEILKGKVIRFTNGKVPEIGWNKIIPSKENIFKEGFVYFVNSYYVVPRDQNVVAAKSDYYGDFVSAVQYKNITGVQFHIEKSGKFGIELLRRWLEC